MGVPAFYRWLSSRYPKCIELCAEEAPVVVDGVEIPVDCTKESENGHVDNLYLDMNGIIHPCFHPENQPAPLTFEECFDAIFKYIDRIMAIVRPRKLLYMAIDGVAPRAKMNQQRSRRFKTARDASDKIAEEKRIRAELKAEGMRVRDKAPVTEVTQLSDSNIITPGTAFMAKLSTALQYYIHQRMNSWPAWKPLTVILSDSNVPGEGEHKIMEFIREQRGRPGYVPNMTHVVSGLDADLIHLALATHEPKFHILREVLFGPQAGDDPEGGATPKVPYQYLKISALREYLTLEFCDMNLPFDFDKERIFDDFVFLCFFVGNDFLPHSPTLEIREGAIDLLMTIYKRQLPHLGGWLCNGASVDLKRVETIVKEVSRCEQQILQKRMRILKNQETKRKSTMKRPHRATPGSSPSPLPPITSSNNDGEVPFKETPKKQKTKLNKNAEDGLKGGMMSVDSEKVWRDLMSVSPEQKAEFILPMESEDDGAKEKERDMETESLVKERLKTSTHEKADMFDSMLQHSDAVKFGDAGWKDRYYGMKFPEVRGHPQKRIELVNDMAKKYVEGLVWVMAYYYEGVASWTWFYPYHYAPFASDLIKISSAKPEFQFGEPFLPFNQLMAVLPPASRFCLPKPLQHLFTEEDSPILDFYPLDFKCDMNGKRFAWQAVVLLPFIDADRLVNTTKEYFAELTDSEKERNKRNLTHFYVGERNPLSSVIKDSMTGEQQSQTVQLDLNPEESNGLNGTLYLTEQYCPETLSAPFKLGQDVKSNRVCMAAIINPSHQRHQCRLLRGAEEQEFGLTHYDVPPDQELWHQHPRAGNQPSPSPQRPSFAIDRDAAHRFVVHQVGHPRLKEDEFHEQRFRPSPSHRRSNLRATAPEFVPDLVTRKALQMTRHLSHEPMIRPPLEPPEAVTKAAIRLVQRVGTPYQVAIPQPQINLCSPQDIYHFQQQQQAQQALMAQMPGQFRPFPGNEPVVPGMQPQIAQPPTLQSPIPPPPVVQGTNNHFRPSPSQPTDQQRNQFQNRRHEDRHLKRRR